MTNSVAYQGVPGSFSYLAARSYFGESCLYLGSNRFENLLQMAQDESAAFAILPIENSLAGSVHENYDLLSRYSELSIRGECHLKIEHHLLGLDAKRPIKDIARVMSHPKAFEQCLAFLEKHPWLEKTLYSDTGSAVREVFHRQDQSIAAIGSIEAAELYQLKVLAKNIEDNAHNYTRFIVLSKDSDIPMDADKCSLSFTLPHKPGSLFKAMEALSTTGLNIAKIESRPIPGKPFEYNFHVDFEFASGSIAAAKAALEELSRRTSSQKVHGFYKASRPEHNDPRA